MSIINDALKKVQQNLTPKSDDKTIPPTEITQKSDAYIYAAPFGTETLPQEDKTTLIQKPSMQNQIKSILALICAMAITAGSGWYIFQQFRQDIPQVQRMAKKTFFKLIHKEDLPDFKTRSPQDLQPLAQITIPPSTGNASNPNSMNTPLTLNVHGIMSNASGNLALINNQVYQEGDDIDGAHIVKISLNSITLTINGTEKTIFVKN